MSNIIKFEKEKRDKLISEIQAYFREERDDDVGDLAANLILDFFTEKLGPEIYNQAVSDSYKVMSDKVDDLWDLQK